jgi:hypothetical protein
MAIKCPINEDGVRAKKRADQEREWQRRRDEARRQHEAADRLREAEARMRAQQQHVSLTADRDVALEVINAGYRVISLKCHPDKGGNHDDMVRLNRVRDRLRGAAGLLRG